MSPNTFSCVSFPKNERAKIVKRLIWTVKQDNKSYSTLLLHEHLNIRAAKVEKNEILFSELQTFGLITYLYEQTVTYLKGHMKRIKNLLFCNVIVRLIALYSGV